MPEAALVSSSSSGQINQAAYLLVVVVLKKSIPLKTAVVTSEQVDLPYLLSVQKNPFEVVALKRAATEDCRC